MVTSNPAELQQYDHSWPLRAARILAAIGEHLADLPGAVDAEYDHIGSTAVPGLAAKPYLDLQVRISPLPTDNDVSTRLGSLGFERALGSRPDSPGVYRDVPRGSERVDDVVWEKSIFTNDSEGVILHIRRRDSPWGRYTIWFRDWLRAHDDERNRYEEVKRRLSAQQMGQPDYDDYTRAKSEFFDEVQVAFEEWAQPSSPHKETHGQS